MHNLGLTGDRAVRSATPESVTARFIRLSRVLGNVTSDNVYCGRWEEILAPRKALQTRPLVASRENYRKLVGFDTGTAHPWPCGRQRRQASKTGSLSRARADVREG